MTSSQNTKTKLHDVAGAVIAATRDEPMPSHLKQHFAAAIAAWRTRHTGQGHDE